MWKPRSRLGLVDAEPIQPLMKAGRQPGPTAARVLEDEHADGAGFAVAHRVEHERRGLASGLAQCPENALEVRARPRAEEGEGDMEALDGAASGQVLLSPVDQSVDNRVGELEGEEEPEPFIPADGSGSAHT